MLQPAAILFGAAFTVAVCFALGKVLLRRLGLTFFREEEHFFALVTGAACLSTIVFLICAAHILRRGVLLAVGAAALCCWMAARSRRGQSRDREGPTSCMPTKPLPSYPGRAWRLLFWIPFSVFAFVYFANAMAPEVSPDGSQYHLGFIARYLAAHGFYHLTTNMYAALSQGTEMLYLFAFAFGKHSAAALVHFAFLVALPLGMALYGRRYGFARAGMTGALLVYLSPIVGHAGTSAYIDVAVACVLFAIFYLLQIWDDERQPALIPLVGLLAGFAYAMKYTAFLAIPYAAGFIAWKMLRKRQNPTRPLLIFGACAFVMIAPWVLKNWIQTGNPLAPFYNRWFPNPYFHIWFEHEYRQQLEHWGGFKYFWQTPMEVTVYGQRLQGFFGPVFLLAPIAFLALRYRQGRQLLLAAAIFAIAYPSNLGTRFLMPVLPFVALAMGMVLVNWKAMAPLLLVAHAIVSWPMFLTAYCGKYALRLEQIPVAAALRIEPEQDFFARRKPDYFMARMVEEKVPPGSIVFGLSTPAMSYHTRLVLGSYECAWSNNLFDMVRLIEFVDWRPTRRLLFRFEPRLTRRLRVVQTAKVPGNQWSISEFRVYANGRELPREPQWRLTARPNPWEVQMAFDRSLVTRWRSWQPLSGGEYVEVDFGRLESVDSVVLDASPNQWDVRLIVEAQDTGGNWNVVAGPPRASDVPEPAPLRRMIARELRWQGIEYLLASDSDPVAKDIKARSAEWGLTLIGEKYGTRLYHVD